MPHCDKCGHFAFLASMQEVQVAPQTFNSPSRYESWCRHCVGPEPEVDEAYERAAARDRLDGFARTGGKDWT